MSQDTFQKLQQTNQDQVTDELISLLEQGDDHHKLFDAKMLKAKQALGLPINRPASLQDVPEEHRKEIEAAYVAAAREVGKRFLSEGKISDAWMYFQVIREKDDVAAALDELPDQIDDYERLEEITQIALYQGVNPVKGIKLMLSAHGTCSTITGLDQILPQLEQSQRAACAKVIVRHLYDELIESVRRHVETRVTMLPPNEPLRKLIMGREWLFEGSNYHIDVSHLNSVVRFARSIEPPAEELDLAIQLAEYGSKLDRQLQYDGEPPFEDFYPAHIHFLNVVDGKDVESGLKYFRDKLEAEPDEQDKPLLAYVLVDLLVRSDRLDEAVDLSAKYLANLSEDVSLSFDELCEKAGRWDVLLKVREEQGDLVGYASALIRSQQQA